MWQSSKTSLSTKIQCKGKDKFHPRTGHGAQRESRRTALFFNFGARWAWVVNATPWPLYLRERRGIHCIAGWVGPRPGMDGCGKFCPTPLQGFEPSNRPARSKSLYRLRHRSPQNPPCPSHFIPLFWGTSPAYPKCSQSAVGHREITEVCRHTLLMSRVSKRTTFHRPLHQRFILHMSRPLMNCGPNYPVCGTHINAICYHFS